MNPPRRFCLRGHDTWETGRYQPGGQCRICAIDRSREARLRDPVHATEIKRRWAKNNPEKVRASTKKSYEKNRLYACLRGARRRAIQGDTRTDPALAQQVLDYYGTDCVYCGEPFTGFDHLQPLSRGGLHEAENLAPCCKSCNSGKQDRPIWVMLNREEAVVHVSA